MKLKDIMTGDVECLKPRDTLAHAAERMRDRNVGAMPVCGDNDRLVGMITDRDLTIRGTAACCHPEKDVVADFMTPHVVYCFDDQDISDAAHLMEQKQIRRLVVLNREKRLVGIVSLGDLSVKGDQHLGGEALEHISEPVGAGT